MLRVHKSTLYRKPMPPRDQYRFSDLRHYLPYVLLLIVFIGGVWIVLTVGSSLDTRTPVTTATASLSVTDGLKENFRNPLSILLLQIIVIIAIAGLFSRIFRRLGQPPVMGEMVAGI